MANKQMSGLLVNGSLKTSGVTFFTRNGKTVVRSAHSSQPRRNTREQFAARQRMKHTTALWQRMRGVGLMFEGGKSVYGRFCTLANALPAVFTPKTGRLSNASFLMPGIPVSDGPLPVVEQRLGEAEGAPALLTGLDAKVFKRAGHLVLYTLQQVEENRAPRLTAVKRELHKDDFVTVGGRLALVGDEFADPTRGWALVYEEGGHCSSQSVLTRCEVYKTHTTEQAMLAAAETYGGLTD